MEVKEMVKYQGNGKYFSILYKDKEDKYFVFFTKTNGVSINCEENNNYCKSYDEIPIRLVSFKNYNIVIPINGNYYIVYINGPEDYELINKILEVVWMEDE